MVNWVGFFQYRRIAAVAHRLRQLIGYGYSSATDAHQLRMLIGYGGCMVTVAINGRSCGIGHSCDYSRSFVYSHGDYIAARLRFTNEQPLRHPGQLRSLPACRFRFSFRVQRDAWASASLGLITSAKERLEWSVVVLFRIQNNQKTLRLGARAGRFSWVRGAGGACRGTGSASRPAAVCRIDSTAAATCRIIWRNSSSSSRC